MAIEIKVYLKFCVWSLSVKIKALLFDVFGTTVDWRSSIIKAIQRELKNKNIDVDAGKLADEWRAEYDPSMDPIRSGKRPYQRLDILHAENLKKVLERNSIFSLDEEQISRLVYSWHNLKPWPDVISSMARLRKKLILASHSNGNISLTLNMARNSGLNWDVILGAEVVGTYKPHPLSYTRAIEILDLDASECMMVAAHNSDLSAAREQGLRTCFILRTKEHGPLQSIDLKPLQNWDYSCNSFKELADYFNC